MKIGFDAKRIFHNTTGLGNYSRDLVRIMATYYPENHYFLYNPKPAKINRLSLTPQISVRQPQNWVHKKIPALWRSKFITDYLKKDNLDIYHGLSGELPFGIQNTGIKSVVTIHDLIFLRYPHLYKPLDRKFYTLKFKYAVRNASQIVAISVQTKQDIVKFFDVEPGNIKVVYQGCHQAFKKNYPDEFKHSISRKFNLPQHFILNVGTIEPRKNAFNIVKAIKNTDYQLVLVGRETPYALEIKKYVTQNNMQNRVQFLKNLNLKELAALYQMADMFVYPSIFEGFGIPIIEALYSRIPVITNAHGVFPEAAGPHSYYIDDVLNPEEIRYKIEEVYHHDNRQRINDSFKFVQKFNDDKIAGNWQQVYNQTIQKSYL